MYPGVQLGMMMDEGGAPDGQMWNVIITAHGILMMFFVLIPGLFGGFGNYFMPLMIGAPDMAFPRLNNLSYWLFTSGATLACVSVFVDGGTGIGWVLYPPLSTSGSPTMSTDIAIFAVHLSGASSILGAINIITTFLNMRAPGMSLFKVPLFPWSIFVTALLILLALPVLAGAITMLLMDRKLWQRRSLIRLVAVIPSCTSTCSGSSVTLKFTSSSFLRSASSAMSSRRSRTSRSSVISEWSGR